MKTTTHTPEDRSAIVLTCTETTTHRICWTAIVGNLLCMTAPIIGIGAAVLLGLTSMPLALCLGIGVGVGSVAFWEGLERVDG